MSIAETIREKLTRALDPEELRIVDESDMHKGHAGARPGGESHFRVTVVSKRFEGCSRVTRQRLVYAALSAEMAGPIHALALTTLAPSERGDGQSP